MANWFENVTKTLADDKLSRRKAMKTAVGITAAAALAAIIPGEAFAASDHAMCSPGTCSTSFSNCGKTGNANCFCFQRIGTTTGVCGCNAFCSSLQACASQSDCPAHHICITNTGCGCTSGFCIRKCTSTCILHADHSGRTAA